MEIVTENSLEIRVIGGLAVKCYISIEEIRHKLTVSDLFLEETFLKKLFSVANAAGQNGRRIGNTLSP